MHLFVNRGFKAIMSVDTIGTYNMVVKKQCRKNDKKYIVYSVQYI